ncbi:MAG: hypothetical protein IH597_12520 [Bacteroidales bacterium]|nr:hypothetical protein [Bacteroidales bacterium]
MNPFNYRLVKRMRGLIMFALLLLTVSLLAQAPQAFKYQAVVRDLLGNPIVESNVSVRIGVVPVAPENPEVYREVHNVVTSAGGLITLDIGSGNADIGSFGLISWGLGDYFVKVEVDIAGGNNFVLIGTSQLLSVPYAIYAKEAGGPPAYTWAQLQEYLQNRTTGATPGMMVYVSDEGKMVYFNGEQWVTTGEQCFPPPSSANAGLDQVDVAGTSTSLEAESPNHGTGLWSIISQDNGVIVSLSDYTDPNALLVSTGGNFVLQWTVTNECGETFDQVYISFCPPNTIANAGVDQTGLIGASTQLSANIPEVGNSGIWSVSGGVGGSFNDIFDPLTTFNGIPGTTYQLRWTISTGCGSNYDEVEINFCYTLTLASAGSDEPGVLGTSITLAGNQPGSGNTGNWTITSGVGGQIVNPALYNGVFTGLPNETYVLKWTISSDCEESFDEVTIYFCPILTEADAGEDQTDIDGTSTQLAANIPGIGNTGLWTIESSMGTLSSGDGFADPTNPQTLFDGTAGATYILRWSITTLCDQFSFDEVTISFCPDLVLAAVGPDVENVCGNYILQGNDMGEGNDAIWAIISGTGGQMTNPGNPDAILAGLPGEEYVLVYTISNACGSSSDTVSVTFEQLPSQANAGNDQENIDDVSTYLEANIPGYGSGVWTIVSGNGGSFAESTNPLTQFFGQPNETYVLAWTISNLCNQSFSDEVTISFCPTLIQASAGPDALNACIPHTLEANNPGSGNTGLWSVLSGTGSSFSDINDPNSTLSGVPGSTYQLVWTISNACGATSDTLIITFGLYPAIANAGPDQLNVEGSTVTLAGNTCTTGGIGQWSIASGDGGVFVDIYDPSTEFTGVPNGQVYELVWTISTVCYSSSDTVKVSFVPVFICGEDLLDERDNKVYSTVQIENKCWMAKNLNVGNQIYTSPSNNGIIEKFCMANEPTNCDVYGGLYSWDELMNYVPTEGSQGICPAGWRVPTKTEFETLATALGGSTAAGGKMKEEGNAHWNNNTAATNESGFTAFGGGFHNGFFIGFKSTGNFATSTPSASNYFHVRLYNSSATFDMLTIAKSAYTSVRCVKD